LSLAAPEAACFILNMRKIILNLAVSLDGYIEGPNGEFDWCFTDQDYGMTGFLKDIDTILFGRKSYEALLRMDEDPYPEKAKVVFSQNPDYIPKNAVSLKIDPAKINELKELNGGSIWLFGGADIFNKFLDMDLVDELQLAVHPIILGGGTPLFTSHNKMITFNLVDSKPYSSGLIQLIYTKPVINP
jgi:dihydrofolate reductase